MKLRYTTRTLCVTMLLVGSVISAYTIGQRRGVRLGMSDDYRLRWFCSATTEVYSLDGVARPDEASGESNLISPDEFCELLVETVFPDTWGRVGGTGAVAVLRSEENRPYLVVRQEPTVHRAIKKLIKTTRNVCHKKTVTRSTLALH